MLKQSRNRVHPHGSPTIAPSGGGAATDDHHAGILDWTYLAQSVLHFRRKRPEERKKTLQEVLKSKALQRLILLLVVLDLVFIAVSVQFPDVGVLSAVAAAADRALLVIFLAEAAALLYVEPLTQLVRKPWRVIDCAFVLVSLVLELHELTSHEDDLHPASPFVSLSIRVWRILRIVHAFTIAVELEYQEARRCAR